jgi:hypothetical protein
VIVSNLGLTVFVKHQVNWLNRFCSLQKGKNRRSPFLPLSGVKASRGSHSLLSYKAYMPHRIYRGTKVYFIRSPHPCLYRGPPSGHASPLGYFDRVIF